MSDVPGLVLRLPRWYERCLPLQERRRRSCQYGGSLGAYIISASDLLVVFSQTCARGMSSFTYFTYSLCPLDAFSEPILPVYGGCSTNLWRSVSSLFVVVVVWSLEVLKSATHCTVVDWEFGLGVSAGSESRGRRPAPPTSTSVRCGNSRLTPHCPPTSTSQYGEVIGCNEFHSSTPHIGNNN